MVEAVRAVAAVLVVTGQALQVKVLAAEQVQNRLCR